MWHPTPVLLPGKSHGRRSLVGWSPWGREESDTTEWLPFHVSLSCMEKEMATHSSFLAWRIPGTGEPGGRLSMGSHRVGHDWATSLSRFTFMHGEGNGNPLQCSCLENPRDGGAWWAAVYGVAQSQTRLKWLSNKLNMYWIFKSSAT